MERFLGVREKSVCFEEIWLLKTVLKTKEETSFIMHAVSGEF